MARAREAPRGDGRLSFQAQFLSWLQEHDDLSEPLPCYGSSLEFSSFRSFCSPAARQRVLPTTIRRRLTAPLTFVADLETISVNIDNDRVAAWVKPMLAGRSQPTVSGDGGWVRGDDRHRGGLGRQPVI